MRTDGKTDGHDEAHSCFSQFCERAQKNQMASSTLREEELDVMVVELVAMTDSVSHFW
jgi:hypothetical protein